MIANKNKMLVVCGVQAANGKIDRIGNGVRIENEVRIEAELADLMKKCGSRRAAIKEMAEKYGWKYTEIR